MIDDLPEMIGWVKKEKRGSCWLCPASISVPLSGQASGDAAGEFVLRLLGRSDVGSVDFAGIAEFLDCSQGEHTDQQVGIVDMIDQPF